MSVEGNPTVERWLSSRSQIAKNVASVGVFIGGGTSAIIHISNGNLPAAAVDTLVTISPIFVTREGREMLKQVTKDLTRRSS